MITWRFEEYAELASTSDTCIARAKEGDEEGLAVLALQQSAGRGSRGRNWLSAPGNLALSVLLRPQIILAQSSVFPLLAGLAAAEVTASALPSGPVPMLKWPNDVLLNGEKCAGLLIDAAPLRDRIDWLVIGIGINLAYAPQIPGRATTSLAAYGVDILPLQAARALLNRLSAWLDILAISGPAPIHAAWLALAHPLGTPLNITAAHPPITGAFAGRSPSGEVLLTVENRIEKFSTGEILLECDRFQVDAKNAAT